MIRAGSAQADGGSLVPGHMLGAQGDVPASLGPCAGRGRSTSSKQETMGSLLCELLVQDLRERRGGGADVPGGSMTRPRFFQMLTEFTLLCQQRSI